MSKSNANLAATVVAPAAAEQTITIDPNPTPVVAPVIASEIAVLPEMTGAEVIDALYPAQPRKSRQSKPGRPYYAAQQLRLAGGLNATIDDKLADAVDLACGKPNRTESLAWLKIAQQICKGWETPVAK